MNPLFRAARILGCALLPALSPAGASAMALAGDKPAAGAKAPEPAAPAPADRPVLIQATVGEATATTVTLDGMTLPYAAARPSIHGPNGLLPPEALRAGMRVRAALTQAIPGRRVLEIWVLR